MTWPLSRRRGVKALGVALPYAVFGFWLLDAGEYVMIAALALLVAGAVVLLAVWLLVLPGRVRLDEEGVRWGRRDRLAWGRVAPFRLNEVDDLPRASTYLLPTTPEEAERQRSGVVAPQALDVPVWVVGMSPARAVALLNQYRDRALEPRLPDRDTATRQV